MKKIIFILFTPFLLTACSSSMSYVEESRNMSYEMAIPGFVAKINCGQTPYQQSRSWSLNPPNLDIAANVNVPDKITTTFKFDNNLFQTMSEDQISLVSTLNNIVLKGATDECKKFLDKSPLRHKKQLYDQEGNPYSIK